ncbi:hypothetical protein GCM10025868_44010 [Angustibacter aerolatus]|uniref:Uncharacterized protein n=1 Tax=Angustibacter aerolatus TaxID=1162965 RepID=A0ABQ6JR41_9ACTN|nr:hypothetical protein GCM10025868_44010 [Angustibacter aerolatus]
MRPPRRSAATCASLRLVDPPVQVLVVQGEDMGRPSRLLVDVPAGSGGIRVTGAAARLP